MRAEDASAIIQNDVHAKLIHIQPGEAKQADAILDACYHAEQVMPIQKTGVTGSSSSGCCRSGGSGRMGDAQSQPDAGAVLAG